MIYERLKKILGYYLLTGILFGGVVISVALIGKDEESLTLTLNSLEHIKITSMMMVSTTEEKKIIIRQIKEMLQVNHHSESNEELLLSAIDRVKANIKECDITVANIEKNEGGLTFPVNIKASFDSYGQMVDSVGYLQGMTFPHFKAESVHIGKSEDGENIIFKINGAFKIPAERIGINGFNG